MLHKHMIIKAVEHMFSLHIHMFSCMSHCTFPNLDKSVTEYWIHLELKTTEILTNEWNPETEKPSETCTVRRQNIREQAEQTQTKRLKITQHKLHFSTQLKSHSYSSYLVLFLCNRMFFQLFHLCFCWMCSKSLFVWRVF